MRPASGMARRTCQPTVVAKRWRSPCTTMDLQSRQTCCRSSSSLSIEVQTRALGWDWGSTSRVKSCAPTMARSPPAHPSTVVRRSRFAWDAVRPEADYRRMNILVVDVGGTHVKLLATGKTVKRQVDSGPRLTPGRMVAAVKTLVADWKYEAVSIGVPAPVARGRIVAEPVNLGGGWKGFD